jgi:CubicO group peptidase (beta-lactamase class C family)
VVRAALRNANRGKPAIDTERPGRTADHGLGVELNQPWFMGRLAAPDSFGHTGFTGTSLLVVPKHRMVVVLLTNRAHPNWSWSDPDVHRVAVADAIAARLGG